MHKINFKSQGSVEDLACIGALIKQMGENFVKPTIKELQEAA